MLSENTINGVRDLPIYQVLSRYPSLVLKPAGSAYKGKCPFHNEKSPSFSVNPTTNRYKCFGCGKGGDAISFVSETENLPFYEAIKKIANDNNVYIEEVQDASYSPERRKEIKDKTAAALTLLDQSRRAYSGHLQSDDADANKVLRYLLDDRRVSQGSIDKWGLGYAPHNFGFITSKLLTKDTFPIAREIGLVKEKDDRNYDAYINRVTIPICNRQGAIIGFGGRDVSKVAPQGDTGDFRPAKYINSSESFIYHKEQTLFGLDKASKAIKAFGYVNLVEGYMSVIRMDQFGMSNTVATCGTALTAAQAKIIRSCTDKVVLMRDGDAAGLKALARDIPILLDAGCKVQVFLLPEGKDPDDLCDELEFHRRTIERFSFDGIMYYADHLAKSTDDVTTRIEAIALFLASISNDITRERYTTRILDEYEWITKKSFLALISKTVKNANREIGEREDETSSVWYRADSTIWVKAKQGWDVVASNFHIYIMYVAEDEKENITWVLRLELHTGDNVYLEVEHDDFMAPARLAKIIATKQLALKINNNHLQELQEFLFNKTSFKRAIKITRYGYHEQSGAFIYSNGAVILCEPGEDGKAYKILKPDDFGMVQTEKYSLSLPKVQKNVRQPFTITGFQITFDEWFTFFTQTHLIQHSFLAASFQIMALYRDIALRHKSFSPILYYKGSAGTGKSSIIRSGTCIYGFSPKEINLKGKNSEPGIIRTMSATANGLIWMDEFINLHPFEGILQAAYDNAGQVKASGSSGLELDNVELKSALALTSNYLPDNPIFFSRCVYNAVMDQTKTKEQNEGFTKMRELEEQGLAQISIELLQYRPLIEKHYAEFFKKLYDGFKQHPDLANETIPERLYANMAQTLTAAFILARAEKIHITEQAGKDGILTEFVDRGAKYIYRQHRVQSEKTALNEFFEIVQMMYDKSEIFEMVHFKLEGDDQIAFRFGSLYTLFKARYRNVHFREAPDRESVKDEIVKLLNVEESKLFTQIRFLSDYTDNTGSKTVPTPNSFRCSYNLLVERFGIDFKSRKMQSNLQDKGWKESPPNRNLNRA